MVNRNIATYTPIHVGTMYYTDALFHSNERDQQLINLIHIVWILHFLDIPLFSLFLSILQLSSISKS